MRIAVIIPAFNERYRLHKVLEELRAQKIQVFLVDDGSKDGTYREALKFRKVIALRHRINLGKGAALKTGVEAAFFEGFDAVVTMDADGQHDPKDLSKFTKLLKKRNIDIVFGSRNMNLGMPLVRYLGNKIDSLLVSFLFGIYVSDLVSGYRAFTRKAYEKIKWEAVSYGVETEMVVRAGKAGLKYCEVPIETIYYDKFKGVTILDGLGVLFNILKWKLIR